MEGPTPVSAFLHAASMITAGVYFFFVFPLGIYYFFIFYFAIFTTLFFSLNAFFFFDLKKITAASTGSQMGYIFFFLSFSLYYPGILLFSCHAIFKSFLFFLAGFFIILNFNFQDIRILINNFLMCFMLFLCFFSLFGLFFF